MTKTELLLVSYELCPYVQRSIITLTEKNATHKREYIDLDTPPEWFTKKSPLGKVPVLIVDDVHIIFESAVICEYLDETTPNSLHPTDPVLKATHRAWIEFGSQILNNISDLYNSSSASSYFLNTKIISGKFHRLEKLVRCPYFSGKDFRMIDAVYATIFRYFDVIDPYLPFDPFEQLSKIRDWRQNLAKRQSVITAVKPEYPELLLDFMRSRNSQISRMIA